MVCSALHMVMCAVEPLPCPSSAAPLYGGTTLLPAASFPEIVYLVGGCPRSISWTAAAAARDPFLGQPLDVSALVLGYWSCSIAIPL